MGQLWGWGWHLGGREGQLGGSWGVGGAVVGHLWGSYGAVVGQLWGSYGAVVGQL